jgi:hypothetical protein
MKKNIKCIYYNDDIEKDLKPDYTDDVEYLMNEVHKRNIGFVGSKVTKIWVDKINDKLFHIIYCTTEYYQYKLGEERDKKLKQLGI